MTRWLLVLAACSASSTQQPVPRAPTSRSNVPKSATPPVAQRSADVGPELDGEPAKLPLPHDHEAVLVTRTQVIVLGDDDPAHVRVESLDAPATERTHAAATAHDAPVEIPLAPGNRLVGLVVWKDAPTLIVLGTSRRLHLVVP